MSDPDLKRLLAEQILWTKRSLQQKRRFRPRILEAGGFVPLGEAEKNRVLFVLE
jgi:hypothetical protein